MGVPKKWRKPAGQIFKLIVGLALLCYIFRSQTRLHEVFQVIIGCDPVAFLFALILFMTTKLQISVRIHFIAQNYMSYPFLTIFRDVLIANLFNTILPVGSGELYRIKKLAGNKSSILESAAIVTLDRTFGFVAILTVGAISLWWADKDIGRIDYFWVVFFVAGGLLFFFGIGWYLKNHPASNRLIAKVQLFFTYIHHHARQAVFLFLFSIFIIVTLTVSIYFLGKGLGIDLSLIDFLRLYPFVLLVTLIPVSIGGLGVREVATITVFGLVGVSKTDCVSLSLMQYGMMLVVAFCGLILLLSISNKNA